MGAQTFNRYNLFYRLERHLLLHERGAVTKKDEVVAKSDGGEAGKFETLQLPPLPSRYQGIDIPKLWFLSSKGSDKKRSHRKSHGVASFTEIARIVASNWKAIDHETMNFVTIVSSMLKAYVDENGIMLGSLPPKKKKAVKLPSKKPTRNDDNDTKEKAVHSSSLALKEKQVKSGSLASSPSTTPDSLPIPSGLTMAVEKRLRSSSIGPLSSTSSDPLPSSSSSSGFTMSVDGRSKTPQVSNYSRNEMRVNGSVLAPVTPSSLFSTANNDFISNVEQSFLREVMGPGVIGNSQRRGIEQRQTISNLLTMVNSMGGQQQMTASWPDMSRMPQQRSASIPGCMPSSSMSIFSDAELQCRRQQQQCRAASITMGSCIDAELQRHIYQQQRRASSMTMGSCTDGEELQRRLRQQQPRASSITMGSSQEPVKELDIDDSEILQMWSCGSGNEGAL